MTKHESQRKIFAKRLKIGVAWRYRLPSHFIKILESLNLVSKVSFYNHLRGDKWPPAISNLVQRYEELLDLPGGWLERGAGETEADLRRMEAVLAVPSLGERQRRATADSFFQKLQRLLDAGLHTVNVNGGESIVPPSKFSEIRHIPILAHPAIINFLQKKEMPAETVLLPVPAMGTAGARAFAIRIPDDDTSMSGGSGESVLPGSIVIIDPDAEIAPGSYVLVRRRSGKDWMLRRYAAAAAWGQAKSWTFEAVNPAVKPMRGRSPAQWVIGGLAVSMMRMLFPQQSGKKINRIRKK